MSGGVAEWLKAAVLKTVVRKYRGFESYLLRQKLIKRFDCPDGEVAEWSKAADC